MQVDRAVYFPANTIGRGGGWGEGLAITVPAVEAAVATTAPLLMVLKSNSAAEDDWRAAEQPGPR